MKEDQTDQSARVLHLPSPGQAQATMWKICPGLERPKNHHLGFLTGSEHVTWMFAYEWLFKTWLNNPHRHCETCTSAASMSTTCGTKIIRHAVGLDFHQLERRHSAVESSKTKFAATRSSQKPLQSCSKKWRICAAPLKRRFRPRPRLKRRPFKLQGRKVRAVWQPCLLRHLHIRTRLKSCPRGGPVCLLDLHPRNGAASSRKRLRFGEASRPDRSGRA